MKKPEIDAYGWVNGKYYDDLSEVINPLIDALVEAQKVLETTAEDALGIATTSDGSTNYYVVDELLHHIKTALRDAGVKKEE